MGGGMGAGHFAARAHAPGAFHHHVAFRHHFRRGFAFAGVPYVVDSGCWQWWHGRRAWVCSGY